MFRSLVFAVLVTATAAPVSAGEDPTAQPRQRMIGEIRSMAATARDTLPPLSGRVLAAMTHVPRHLFVPDDRRDKAYRNEALEIGHGQTISQPFVVAVMTELVAAKPGSRILEIGTGSGYQAAVLAELGAEVYSIEIIPELGQRAAVVLKQLGYDVHTRIGDGYGGWADAGPFDGIVVTAAPDQIPQPLKDQLKPGGRMVIPVGAANATQDLLLLIKRQDGRIETRKTVSVGFVPLTRSTPPSSPSNKR